MAAALIAVIVVLVLGHAAPQLAALRRFGWFDAWQDWLDGHAGDAMRSRFGILLSVGLPVALLALLQALVDDAGFGLAEFLLAVLVMFWCWGPRDLDLDVEAVLDAPDRERRLQAARALLGDEAAAPLNGPALVEAVFRGALQRWFAVLLWFLLLGPAGALLYRLAQRAAARGAGAHGGAEYAAMARRLRDILEWPVAQLVALSLALAADFDAVLRTWREWHEARGRGWFALDTGFLGAVARASVDSELVEDADGELPDPPPPLLELRDAMSLVWRVLLLWLTVLAVVVLAGYVN